MLTIAIVLALQDNPHYEQLKKIEWLIGTWAGKGNMNGQDYEDEYVMEWTASKRFIRNFYAMKQGGKVVHSDTGMIGWDPVKKKLVGVNFGMDGTIGWGTEVEQSDGVLVVEGKTAGSVVSQTFRFTLKRVDADHLEASYGDWKMTYERKKFTPSEAPEMEKARLHYTHLKHLDWLKGTWKGTVDTAVGKAEIEYSFAWTLNKNFLVKTVTARAMGQVAYSATEWIGWDAENKKVVVIGFVQDGTIVRATAVETADQSFVVEGTAGDKEIRMTIRKGDKLSVLIERREDGKWLTDKEASATKQ